MADADFHEQFSETWQGGYYEGDPRDLLGATTLGVWGYNSAPFTVYLACIRPYVARDTVALEIGPGRGAWSKAILDRGAKRLYAVDVAPAEHTHFWDYVGHDTRATYIATKDFELAEIPDNSIDYFFSVGVFCHLKPEMSEAYICSLARKLKPGADGFVGFADFDKYNACIDHPERYSLLRVVDRERRKVWLPTRLAYTLTWRWFRSRMDVGRVSKECEKNLTDADGRAGWYHWGVESACVALRRNGFEIVDADIGAIARDPLTHFRRPV